MSNLQSEAGNNLVAEGGSTILQSEGSTSSTTLAASGASYIISATAATFERGKRLQALGTTYLAVGTPATLAKSGAPILAASPATYHAVGSNATLLYSAINVPSDVALVVAGGFYMHPLVDVKLRFFLGDEVAPPEYKGRFPDMGVYIANSNTFLIRGLRREDNGSYIDSAIAVMSVYLNGTLVAGPIDFESVGNGNYQAILPADTALLTRRNYVAVVDVDASPSSARWEINFIPKVREVFA